MTRKYGYELPTKNTGSSDSLNFSSKFKEKQFKDVVNLELSCYDQGDLNSCVSNCVVSVMEYNFDKKKVQKANPV